jgi:polysaccharide pyruvyl transferase WcaK-like protein
VKTVFVVNELDSRNIGDRAIFSGIEQALIERGSVVLAAGLQSGMWFGSKRPEMVARRHAVDVNSKLIVWLKKLVRPVYLPVWIGRYSTKAWQDSRKIPDDAIVMIGGGGILMNNDLHFPFAIFIRTFISRMCAHPVAFVGISLGGRLNWMCRMLIRYSLLKASHVYVRDGATLKYLHDVLQVHSAKIGPDCAFLGAPAGRSGQTSLDYSRRNMRPCVAINVMENSAGLSSHEFRQYRQFIKSLVTQNAHLARFVFFTTGWPADHAVAIELAAELERDGNGTTIVDIAPIDGIDSLNEVLLNADTVIASRLHSAILTIKLGLPPLCLNVTGKNSGFMRSIGLSDLILDYATPAPVLETLQRIIESRKSVTKAIATTQRQMGDLMLDDVLGN